jgi:transposase-like protein
MRTKAQTEGPEFKATVAWAALTGSKSLPELAREYGLDPATIARWKQELLAEVAGLFNISRKTGRA